MPELSDIAGRCFVLSCGVEILCAYNFSCVRVGHVVLCGVCVSSRDRDLARTQKFGPPSSGCWRDTVGHG